MKKNKKYTALGLQNLRDKLVKEIKNNWVKIQLFNIIEPNNGEIRHFNLNEVYKEIVKFEEDLIKVKCGIQFINMLSLSKKFGFKLTDYNKNTPHETIFKLQQLKERLQKLEKLTVTSTSNTADIALNKTFVNKEMRLLTLQIEQCSKELDMFNKDLEIELDL